MNKNITWHNTTITKKQRAIQKRQKPTILWFTGLSGSGKSTLANALEKELYQLGYHTYLLDGDNIRSGLNSDLGFDNRARVENIRRIGEVAKLFVDSGLIVLSAFISPFQKERDSVRALVEKREFIEIFVNTPLDICEKRDPKGLYLKAREGEIKNFTGIDSPYEEPINPEIIINGNGSVEESVKVILDYLVEEDYVK